LVICDCGLLVDPTSVSRMLRSPHAARVSVELPVAMHAHSSGLPVHCVLKMVLRGVPAFAYVSE
jgi:hypothetical protein